MIYNDIGGDMTGKTKPIRKHKASLNKQEHWWLKHNEPKRETKVKNIPFSEARYSIKRGVIRIPKIIYKASGVY